MTEPNHRDLPLHAQIANLEHRLAFLRDKRETFIQQGRLVKRMAWITLAIIAALVPCLAIATQADPLPAIFISSILVAAVAAVLWFSRNSVWMGDAPSEIPGFNRYTSYGVFVLETIKECERQLAELRARAKLDGTAGDPPNRP